MRRAIASSLLLAWLSGCVQYQPMPVDLAQVSGAAASRSLDRALVDDEVRRIAPSAALPREGLDRLGLFAALLVYDPRIAAARRAIDTAAAEAHAAHQAAGPTFTLTGEYANDPATSSPWLIGGAVDLPLDRGARRDARIDRAQLAVLLARYDYAETVWAERTALDNALVDYFAADARIPLLEAQVALFERQLAALDRRVEAGETAGVTVYPYRTQAAQAARALDEERALRGQALAAMAATIGLPLAALEGQILKWPDFADEPAPLPGIDAAERTRAAAGRADVLRTLAAYDQAEADLRLEVAQQYPAISIAPGYTWERGLVKLPLSINLALPSWDLNRAAIEAAEARRTQAAAQIEAAISGAQGSIAAALAQREAALAALQRIVNTELPLAEAGAARAEARIARGAIDRAEWAGFQVSEIEARLAALDATTRVRRAETALEDALRRPLAGPELAIVPGSLGDLP